MTARRYRRSRHLVLRWSGDAPILLHAATLDEFTVTSEVVDALTRLGAWTTADELAAAGSPITADGLDRLLRAGILEEEDEAPGADGWDPLELAVHRRTARAGEPRPLREASRAAPSHAFALPRAGSLDGGLEPVLAARRTRRDYGDRPLALGELATLLWHAAGGDVRHRPFASAGARAELELYVVANDVAGLAPGAWRYAPGPHALEPVCPRDAHQARLCAAVHDATGRRLSGDPAVILLITAVFERVACKYGHMALSLIYKDTGCLMQTLYLVATALELAPCAIGGGDETANARWLGLDPLVEPQVGCFLVGPAAATP